MLRRWLIRVPCLLALAFVVGVWVTSYFAEIAVNKEATGRAWVVLAAQGLGSMGEDGGIRYPDSALRFSWFGGPDPGMPPTTLGFYVGPWPRSPKSLMIILPLWLPTLLLAALCWFVWRKMRAKYNGRGFPVEPPAPAN